MNSKANDSIKLVYVLLAGAWKAKRRRHGSGLMHTINLSASTFLCALFIPFLLLGAPTYAQQDSISIEVDTPVGFRPADFSILPTQTPTISIMLPDSLYMPVVDSVFIFQDDDDILTAPLDVTVLFTDLLVNRADTAMLDSGIIEGNNSVEVLLYTPDTLYENRATMLNYNDSTVMINPWVDTSLTFYDSALETTVFETILLLDMDDDSSESAISRFLTDERLRPIGIFIDQDSINEPIFVIVDITENIRGLPVLDLLDSLNEATLLLETPLEEAILDEIVPASAPAGEVLPARLIKGDQPPNIPNDPYGKTSIGGFDNDGDMLPDFTDVDELNLAWQHFFMETFAAHGLRNKVIGADPPNVSLAVVDGGFGNGGANAGVNPVLNDIPLARLGDGVTYHGIDFTGPPVGGRRVLRRVLIADLRDLNAPRGHGTPVTIFGAGGGSLILGPGAHLNVLPVKMSGSLRNNVQAITAAANEANVAVINYSLAYRPAPPAVTARRNRWYRPAIRRANRRGIIFVDGAGNAAGNADQVSPASLAPNRGTRNGANFPLMLVVGATDIANEVRGPEQHWWHSAETGSNSGAVVSITAPGGARLIACRPNGVLRTTPGGTSFAAPMVAGLAAEMVELDEDMRGVPGNNAQRRARRQKIVEMIEATADDLGTSNAAAPYVNNDAGNGGLNDNRFGWGRINAWKAILAVVNNGISAEGRLALANGNDNIFQTLPLVDENSTEWYGFEIITANHGATVWLNGTQLADAASRTPDPAQVNGAVTSNITAYKGILSDSVILRGIDDDGDGILDEDPTSGIVPVGNSAGEYYMTFSIQKSDLIDGGEPKVLSLRKMSEGVNDPPFFNLRVELHKMRQGLVPGVVFDDFVFEITPTDFGDAYDEMQDNKDYPSLLMQSNGARSLNSNLEWFADPLATGATPNDSGVSPEPNASPIDPDLDAPDDYVDPDGRPNFLFFNPYSGLQDLDRYDDGITFYPLEYKPGQRGDIEFHVCVADPDSPRYENNNPDKSLWVNAWIDWSTNRVWDEANNEHIIDGLQLNPRNGFQATAGTGGTFQMTSVTRVGDNCALIKGKILVDDQIGNQQLWVRFRLDYGENLGRNDPRHAPEPFFRSDVSLRDESLNEGVPQPDGNKIGFEYGASRFGEVQDYLLGTDFGDAPDPFIAPGRYPTKKANAGARHLDMDKEWLGATGIVYSGPGSTLPGFWGPSVTREIDAIEPPSPAGNEQDGVMNLQPANTDILCDGINPKAFLFIPGVPHPYTITVHSSISTRGYDNTQSANVPSLFQPCNILPIPVMPITPAVSSLRGRYSAWIPEKRIYIHGWADWNGNGIWEAWEKFLEAPVDPETFGKDRKYTLGEPFVDANRNGVWDFGENFTDVAGINSITYTCNINPPPWMAPFFWLRFRLDYGENGANNAVTEKSAYSLEKDRSYVQEKGGALFGEVEDYPAVSLCKIIKEILRYYCWDMREHWTQEDSVITDAPWLYSYQVDGMEEPVYETVTGELRFREQHPEFNGMDVIISSYPPHSGTTDWEQTITYDFGTAIVKGVSMTGPPWDYQPLCSLEVVHYRIPVLAPGSVDRQFDTIYTAVNLGLYYGSNPLWFNGGSWSVGQSLSDLSVTITDGRIDGLEGIYWATTPIQFDPGSDIGFTPVGGPSTWLNSLTYSSSPRIIKEKGDSLPPSVSDTIRIEIEKTHNTLQGHFEYVSITLENNPVEVGGFDFLIAYDASALTAMEVTPGQLLEDCDWEYFTYRFGADGNCRDACPSGLLRIIAVADMNDGINHPSCYGPPDTDPHELAKMKFLVTNDRTFEGQYVPIYFFWGDCGDNTISSIDGETLYISGRIYDFEGNLIWDEEDDDQFPEDARIPWVGAPDYCLNPDPDKPSAERFIDFVYGGIDIIPDTALDDRGDINLNGVANEIADAVMFTNYFVYNLAAFGDHVEASVAASDVNADGIPLTVADLVYMVRIITGDALPYQKLSPGAQNAAVHLSVNHSATAVSVNSETDVGGGYFVLEYSGYEIGEPQLINGASDMTLKYNDEDGILKVLVYSMEGGVKVKAGTENIFVIPVKGEGSIELREVQLSDYQGNLMTVDKSDQSVLPQRFTLHQNYPNPFNVVTQIIYELPKESHVKIEILNVMGQKVITLIDRFEVAGVHRVEWNGTSQSGEEVASGIYFYRLETEGFVATKKMTVLK
jgi:hypothetical protein